MSNKYLATGDDYFTFQRFQEQGGTGQRGSIINDLTLLVSEATR